MTKELEKHYNKFCEDKRLTRRHGQVEYITSMKYIHECIGDNKDVKILDVGAGTGRYSVQLANEGYDVTAVELVKHNLGMLKAKKSSVKAYQGTALDLSRLILLMLLFYLVQCIIYILLKTKLKHLVKQKE